MKKILLVTLLVALFLRLFSLEKLPQGFHADEVRLGWNSFSILKTGKDDWGNKFPLYYNTFGDFRPTGIFYLTIPSILLLGKNEFAVRFPSALIGALTIIPLYFFVKELFPKNISRKVGLFSAFVLSLSPWHISVSRATSEVAISLFFVITGFYLLLKFQKELKTKYIIFSFIFLFLSYFFYHSVRLLVPLYLIGFLAHSFTIPYDKKVNAIRYTFVFLVLFSLITGIFMLQKEARGRFSQVSIFNDLDVKYELSRMPFDEGQNKVFVARLFHNKPVTYTKKFITEYLKYFSADFLIGESSKPARYTAVGMGVLTYLEIFLVLIGIYYFIKIKSSPLLFYLLFISPIPAALTTEDSPNLHRAFFMVIFFTIISGYGLTFLRERKKTISTLIILCFFVNFVYFLHMYTVHSAFKIAPSRNVGAKEASILINSEKDNFSSIILTNIPDELYPWIGFFGDYDPENFNKATSERDKGTWNFENITFTGQRCPSRDAFATTTQSLLVVDAEGCATESNLKERKDVKIKTRFLRPNDSEVYVIWEKK